MIDGPDGDAIDVQRKVLSRMPILAELLPELRKDRYSFGLNVFLFGTQHLMSQALGLCAVLNSLGLAYDRMFLAGKPYSSDLQTMRRLAELGVNIPEPRRYQLDLSQSEEQVRDLRELAMLLSKRKATSAKSVILVLDDGGHALTGVRSWLVQPYSVVGVEQTASGFRQTGIGALDYPTVDVGASAVKRICEPPMVAQAALARASDVLRRSGSRSVGIVGLGYIGLALHEMLTAQGYRPLLFDARSDAYPDVLAEQCAQCIHEVFDSSDVIFGCTGADITRNLSADVADRGLQRRTRHLVSLSSGDDEFFTLKSALIAPNSGRTYAIGDIPDVSGEFCGSRFVIVRNGFPINFDNSGESAPLEQIQGTIAALVAAICQVSELAKGVGHPGRVTLDLAFQGWLYDRWLQFLPVQPDEMKSISLARAEKLSKPRFEPKSSTLDPSFGPWTEDRISNPDV